MTAPSGKNLLYRGENGAPKGTISELFWVKSWVV
jgi:hypothetical protein